MSATIITALCALALIAAKLFIVIRRGQVSSRLTATIVPPKRDAAFGAIRLGNPKRSLVTVEGWELVSPPGSSDAELYVPEQQGFKLELPAFADRDIMLGEGGQEFIDRFRKGHGGVGIRLRGRGGRKSKVIRISI